LKWSRGGGKADIGRDIEESRGGQDRSYEIEKGEHSTYRIFGSTLT
jgi:hypothetical protein